jgi:hypothetical protein
VITGFNTDIIYQGVTYHVQTEDKGLDTPLILSLVYDRGTILASKRSPYEDLLQLGFDEKVLVDRLQKQHKVICAAIRAGRIDDLKRMTLESAAKQKNAVAKETKSAGIDEVKTEPPKLKLKVPLTLPEEQKIVQPPIKPENAAVTQKAEVKLPEEKIELPVSKDFEPPKIEKPDEIWDTLIEITENEIVFDDVQVVEEEVILSGEAVEIIADFNTFEMLPKDDLSIELVNDTAFKGGERKTLSILVAHGNASVSNASVMVKVLGSAFRPLIFHAKTDSNGVAVIHLQLPHFRSGRAAVLVKAMSGGEEAELRRVVSQG